jgi:sterol desaturase/sphingolipid hydroxylase (fatty acid hydroxylase superfamily)/uncharacterized protein (DUF2147 family)
MLATLAPLAPLWAEIFLVDLARYLIGAGGVALALLLGGSPVARRRIQARRAGTADQAREIRLSVQTVAIFASNGLVVFLLNEAGAIAISAETPGFAIALAELIAIVVAHDAWFYWTHRAQHARSLFRRVHLAHHRSQTPTPWAAYAFAPAEAVIQAIFLPLFLLCLPVHALSLFLFLVHMILRNALGHSGHELMPAGFARHWLGQWITTTVHHDLHHSEGRHNFGLYFTWWDRLLRTEHPDYHARFDAVAKPWSFRIPRPSRAIAPFVLAGLAALGGWDSARAETIEGLWVTERMDAVIEIDADMQELSGRIRWLREPESSRAALGAQLFSRFSAGSDRWVGRILSHEDGRAYRAAIRPLGRNWLEVRGYRGPFHGTQLWRRLSSFPRAQPERSESRASAPAPRPIPETRHRYSLAGSGPEALMPVEAIFDPDPDPGAY